MRKILRLVALLLVAVIAWEALDVRACLVIDLVLVVCVATMYSLAGNDKRNNIQTYHTYVRPLIPIEPLELTKDGRIAMEISNNHPNS